MNMKITPENAQGIADTFNEWRKKLPPEKRSLADAHIDALRQENDRLNRMPNLGCQSRAVCLAYIYMLVLEHDLEGKPLPKVYGEIK